MQLSERILQTKLAMSPRHATSDRSKIIPVISFSICCHMLEERTSCARAVRKEGLDANEAARFCFVCPVSCEKG